MKFFLSTYENVTKNENIILNSIFYYQPCNFFIYFSFMSSGLGYFAEHFQVRVGSWSSIRFVDQM